MQGLLHNFGIDWKLLLAQIINFLVLLVILRAFAYKPLVKILRERREVIEKGVNASKESQVRLGRVKEEEQQKIDEATKKGLGIVEEARSLADQEKDQILALAKKKEETIMADTAKAVEQEKRKMFEEVMGNAEHIMQSGLGKVLLGMNPGERDKALIRRAIEELKTAETR
jgi:F-type H+-transporting ATPase subunit b